MSGQAETKKNDTKLCVDNQESKQANQDSCERPTGGETKSTKLCDSTVVMTYREVESEVEASFRAQVLGKKMTQDEYDRNFSNFHAKKDSDAKLKIDMLCASRNVQHSFASYVVPKQRVQQYFQDRLARGEIDEDEYAKNFRGCVARKGSEAHRLVAYMVEEHKNKKKAQPQKRKAVRQFEAHTTLVVSTWLRSSLGWSEKRSCYLMPTNSCPKVNITQSFGKVSKNQDASQTYTLSTIGNITKFGCLVVWCLLFVRCATPIDKHMGWK